MTKIKQTYRMLSILATVFMTALLACDDRGYQPPNNLPSPGQASNPSPADGATNLGMNIEFTWECESPDSNDLRYAVYMGTDILERAWGPYSIRKYRSSWGRHINARYVLYQIYQGQVEYFAQNNRYALNGVSANFASPNAFQSIGVVIDSSDWYNYAMGASANTFICYASANLDTDPDNDTWHVDQTGVVTNTWSDIEIPYQPGATYRWQVVAYNERNDSASSSVWQFTTSPDSMPVNYPPNIPLNPFPPDWSNQVDTFPIFDWQCTDPDNDTLVYDLYLGFAGNLILRQRSISGTYIDTEWRKQAVAQAMLYDIYARQQAYRNMDGCYCLNGVSANRWDNNFGMLGVIFSFLDDYTYSIASECSSFTCTATANIDADPAIDTWSISEAGVVTNTNEDCDVPYAPGAPYTWTIIARDSHGHETVGPPWNFTTGPNR
jgi:hypothetical protein